jgi:hypothetical protein
MKRIYKGYLWWLLAAVFVGANCSKSSGSGSTQTDDGTITYEQSSALFPNPERGFIKTINVNSGGAGLDLAQMQLLRRDNVSMILRLYYFNAFKDKQLDQATLQLIQADFDKIRTAGLKIILRFAYTDDMAGTDAPLNIIEQHLDQLKPLFEANQDVIAFVQAGFIGAWGEWHSSSNGLANTESRRAVLTKLLAVLPADLMVQVRTPVYKQEIFNTTIALNASEAYTTAAKARVGHHNDCFLSNSTDYGTYTNVAVEKQYISSEASYVPTGGETCPPTDGFNPNCSTSTNEMKLLKWTYLNLDWYPATITAWKNTGCFDEYQKSLGYRLALTEGNFPDEATAGASLKVVLSIANKGYAPLYHKKNTVLVLKNTATGTYYDKPLSIDLRTCKPAATLKVEESVSLAGVPAGTYELYLKIADKAASLSERAQYAIRLANNNGWLEEHGGINNLKHNLVVK